MNLNGSRLRGSKVYVVNEKTHHSDYHKKQGQFCGTLPATTLASQWYKVKCSGDGIKGKSVKVTNEGSNDQLHFCGIVMYGSQSDVPRASTPGIGVALGVDT